MSNFSIFIESDHSKLQKAVQNNDFEGVKKYACKKLLDTHPGQYYDWGLHPLEIAVKRGNKEIIKHLLDCGSAPMTALYVVVRQGDFDLAKMLLESEVVRNNIDYTLIKNIDRTPLQSSLLNGHLKIAALLIDHGANLDAPLAYIDGLSDDKYTRITAREFINKQSSNEFDILKAKVINQEKVFEEQIANLNENKANQGEGVDDSGGNLDEISVDHIELKVLGLDNQ